MGINYKEELQKVLSFKDDRVGLGDVPPSKINDILEDLGASRGGMETNGWDYDYWVDYIKDGQTFVLSGSGWYGGTKFSIKEE